MSIEISNTRYAKPTTYIKIILGVLAAPLIAALVLISFIGLSLWAFLFFIFVLSLLISKKYTNFLKNLKKILVFS